MNEQRDVSNRLVSGKRDFREAVFSLAAHPAREAYEASRNPSLSAVAEAKQLFTVQQFVSFAEIKLPAL